MMLCYEMESLLGSAWFHCNEGGRLLRLIDGVIGLQLHFIRIVFSLPYFNYHVHPNVI